MRGPLKRLKFQLLLLLILFIAVPVFAQMGPNSWVKYVGNPVFTPSLSGWDSGSVVDPVIVHDATGYKMWYLGMGPSSGPAIGYSTSTDGFTWSRTSYPILKVSPHKAWDNLTVQPGSVIRNGSSYLMWYRGAGPSDPAGAFGLATASTSVTVWTKYTGNPVMNPGTSDNYYDLGRWPYVIKVGNMYEMWYAGKMPSYWGPAIYYATSPDGINWSKHSGAVLTPALNPNDWDAGGVLSPSVYFDGSTYWMFYTGETLNLKQLSIGYATSRDGITWTKSSDNPILAPSQSGWDDYGSVGYQGVVFLNGNLQLYYSAAYGSNGKVAGYRIGMAQPPSGFPLPEVPAGSLTLLLAVMTFSAVLVSRKAGHGRISPS